MLHRAADVAKQHDRPRAGPPPPPRQLGDLSPGAKAARQRTTEIDAAASARAPPSRATRFEVPRQPLQSGSDHGVLFCGQLCKILGGNPVEIAPHAKDQGLIHELDFLPMIIVSSGRHPEVLEDLLEGGKSSCR